MSLLSLSITALIILICVGWFIYTLATKQDSISSHDPSLMELFRDIQRLTVTERERLDTALRSGVFNDDNDS